MQRSIWTSCRCGGRTTPASSTSRNTPSWRAPSWMAQWCISSASATTPSRPASRHSSAGSSTSSPSPTRAPPATCHPPPYTCPLPENIRPLPSTGAAVQPVASLVAWRLFQRGTLSADHHRTAPHPPHVFCTARHQALWGRSRPAAPCACEGRTAASALSTAHHALCDIPLQVVKRRRAPGSALKPVRLRARLLDVELTHGVHRAAASPTARVSAAVACA